MACSTQHTAHRTQHTAAVLGPDRTHLLYTERERVVCGGVASVEGEHDVWRVRWSADATGAKLAWMDWGWRA